MALRSLVQIAIEGQGLNASCGTLAVHELKHVLLVVIWRRHLDKSPHVTCRLHLVKGFDNY
jgi:hypothetical protein